MSESVLGAARDLPPLLVRPAEAARLLAISERTLWALTNRGEIPPVRTTGRSVRYDVRDLRAWIDRKKAEAASPATAE